MFVEVGSFTSSHHGYLTIDGVQLRVFRFDRLPNISGSGLYLADPTVDPLPDELPAISYFGSYEDEHYVGYTTTDSGEITTEATTVVVCRKQPDIASVPSEHDTLQHITALTRAMGGTIKPGQTDPYPTYRRGMHAPQATPVVPMLEALDEAISGLEDYAGAGLSSTTNDVQSITVVRGKVTEVLPNTTGVTGTFANIKQLTVAKGKITAATVNAIDGYTVTATTYCYPPTVIAIDHPLAQVWRKVVITGLPADTKAVVLCALPHTDYNSSPQSEAPAANENPLMDVRIVTSPDAVHEYPMFSMAGGGGYGGHSETYGVGSQLVSLVAADGDPSGSKKFYIKNVGNAPEYPACYGAGLWTITLLAYQR